MQHLSGSGTAHELQMYKLTPLQPITLYDDVMGGKV